MAECLLPLDIKNKNKTYKLNGQTRYISVPCGKCPNCIKKRIAQWQFRLEQEQKQCTSSSFITLTYQDENLPINHNNIPTLDKRHHQLFMKRLRKYLKQDYPNNPPLKYYMVGEYGDRTERPHYHSILFNLPGELIYNEDTVTNIWNMGKIQIAICNQKTIGYVCGYLNKRAGTIDEQWERSSNPLRIPEFSMMSKGLGKNWLTIQTQTFYEELMEPYIIIQDGKKLPLPRYFRQKLWTRYNKLTKKYIPLREYEAKQRALTAKAKTYAEKNYPYQSETHKIEYTEYEILKFKKQQQENRKNI